MGRRAGRFCDVVLMMSIVLIDDYGELLLVIFIFELFFKLFKFFMLFLFVYAGIFFFVSTLRALYIVVENC